MKDRVVNLLVVVVLSVLFLGFLFGCYKLERWINWKLDYGGRVDSRVESLEKRIEKLEDK